MSCSKRPLTRNCVASIKYQWTFARHFTGYATSISHMRRKIEIEHHYVEDELNSESSFRPMGIDWHIYHP